ncbi:MAG TPA: GNAT family protein [Micromonosporaceae bacterium]|jgi:RimJ/RimL family protein N-acetyltransferase
MREELATPDGYSLRPWTSDDVDAVLAAFRPAEMLRQAGGRPIDTPELAKAWIAATARGWREDSGYAWAVLDAAGAVVGNALVNSIDRRHGTGWVSYWTVPAGRGRGAATAATSALAGWALSDLGLFRLELGHRTDNPASCRVASEAGFAVEGLERSKLLYDGVRYDVELHARLATDPVTA